jgi:hypothetical protein
VPRSSALNPRPDADRTAPPDEALTYNSRSGTERLALEVGVRKIWEAGFLGR